MPLKFTFIAGKSVIFLQWLLNYLALLHNDLSARRGSATPRRRILWASPFRVIPSSLAARDRFPPDSRIALSISARSIAATRSLSNAADGTSSTRAIGRVARICHRSAKCSASRLSPLGQASVARQISVCSSRMLPGHECLVSSSSAFLEIPTMFFPYSSALRARNASANGATSSVRSRKGGA